MRPLISVVVVNLNNADGLERTLQSLEQQSSSGTVNTDIFIVDGVSSDRSVAVAESYMHANSNIQLISEKDSGVYDAMNKGIAATTGDYLIFMNSGDRFGNNAALELLSAALAQRPAWLITGAVNLGGGRRASFVIENMPHKWLRHAFGLQSHCHQASVFRRDLVNALDGYRCDFGIIGDFDFIMRAGAVASPLELPQLLVEYEGGGLSERNWRALPELQHRVRQANLGLQGGLAFLDGLWARYQLIRRFVAHYKGRITRTGRAELPTTSK